MDPIIEEELRYLQELAKKILNSSLFKSVVIYSSVYLITIRQLRIQNLRCFLSDILSSVAVSHRTRLRIVREMPEYDGYVSQKEYEMCDFFEKLSAYYMKTAATLAPLIPRTCSRKEFNETVSEFEKLLLHPFFDNIFLENGPKNQSEEYLHIQWVIEEREAQINANAPPPPPPRLPKTDQGETIDDGEKEYVIPFTKPKA